MCVLSVRFVRFSCFYREMAGPKPGFLVSIFCKPPGRTGQYRYFVLYDTSRSCSRVRACSVPVEIR